MCFLFNCCCATHAHTGFSFIYIYIFQGMYFMPIQKLQCLHNTALNYRCINESIAKRKTEFYFTIKSFHLTSSFMSFFASASNANILASCARLSAISGKPDFFLLTSLISFITFYNSNLSIFAVYNFLNKTPHILSMQLYLIVEYLW